MEKQTNIIIALFFVAIFFVVMLLALVIIIGALNQGNTQTGKINLGIANDYVNNYNGTTQSVATTVTNPNCQINSVSIQGLTLNSSSYTVNGCQITIIGNILQ